MRYLSDANRFGRITAGIRLIAAPLTVAATTVVGG